MAYTYDPHSWSTKEAITKSKMQHIEDGIKGAADQANANETALNNLQTTSSAEDVALWNALGYSKEILKNTTIQQAIQNLQDQIGDSNMKQDLAALKTEVENAREQGYADLRATLQHIRDNVNSVTTVANRADGTASALETAINNARGTYATLKDRIDAIVSANDEAHRGFSTDITTIANTLSAPVDGSTKSAKELFTQIVQANRDTTDTLDKRFDAIDDALGNITGDAANTIATRLNNVITEVEAARASAANGNTTYTNLDARLEADETNIKNTKDEVNAAHRAAVDNDTLNNRFNDIETKLTNAKGDYDTIEARFNKVETDISNAATATSVQTAISGINTTIGNLDTSVRGLDGRLDAIDGGEAFDATNGTLAQHVATIQNQISHAITQDDAGGLTERITAAESDIDTIEASIGNGFDSTNTVAAAIATKANSSDMETALAGKVSTEAMNTAITNAVKNISTTIVVDNTKVNFDTDNRTPISFKENSGITLNDKDDYLIQEANANGKYYYWKHINNAWHLMGGASNGEGGGGTGNNNAAEYMTYEAFNSATKEVNKDYYVLQDDSWRHYRYINTAEEGADPVLSLIEIGQIIDTNKIKRYNIDKTYDEDEKKYYLKLYQYDYDENNNNIDSDLTDILPWKPSTPYVVDARVVANDGYAYKCITANTDAEWNAANWEKISNICTIQFIELPEGGGGGAAGGVVKRLTRITDQAIETITGVPVLLEAFYAYHTTELDDNGVLQPVESSSGQYVLRTGNTIIATGTVPSGAYKATNMQPGDPGYMQFDITKYCSTTTTSFELVVTTEGTSQTKNWTVRLVDLHLESSAPDVQLISSAETYNFQYTAFGALTKTLHVIIDSDTEHEITSTLPSSTSGRETSITIPAQEHGAHKIEMYLEAIVGGVKRTTEPLIREYIWYDNKVGTTILASPYNEQTITEQQYSTIEIPYQVYKKDASTIDVEYYLDDKTTPFGSVKLDNANTGLLTYLATEQGAHTVTIKVDNVTISIALNITQLDIDISPVDGAIIDFNPATLENSSINRLPSWEVGSSEYKFIDSSNFNWSNDVNGGGYKKEEDGKALVIKAGTYIDLNYPLFAVKDNKNILSQGGEFKIVFKTKAVRKADAVWLQSVDKMYDKDVGLQLGVHSGWLKTTRAVDENINIEPDENGQISMNGTVYNIWKPNTAYAVDDVVVLWDENDEDNHQIIFKCVKAWDNTHAQFLTSKGKVDSSWQSIGKISTSVAATDSYLYLSYSEQDKIELDINIDAASQFIMSYEDGVPSKVYAYSLGTGGDGLQHNNTIRIGSNDCDVYLYSLRIYNNALSTANILQNFIADGRDIDEKVARYNRNCIYWDPTQNEGEGGYFPSPSLTATLDPIKLAEVMPDVKILMLDTPVFTTSKKDFVMNSTLRCIHAAGGNVYTSRGDADNWFFTNGFHSGQGTTSDNYGQSARNVDFLFEVDGQHYPTKAKNMGKYTPSKDYVSKVYVGEDASEWVETEPDSKIYHWVPTREPEAIEVCEDWKGDNCKVSLTETSVPNNYFNLKVNVASSENVNNALFQKRFDDYLVYTSPAQTNQIAKHRGLYSALGQDPSKIKVKNSMEFVPAVLFVRENQTDENGNPLGHVEFNDCNWHFYALGNIGDSKKTDYTRAYDPDDINEFTCENSDNNTNNGQFQSGVFDYNGHEAIETDYRAWTEDGEYVQNNIVVKDGVIYICSATNATTGLWIDIEWNEAPYTNWTEDEEPYFAPRTNPNSMQYKFPIKPSQWNVQLNGEYLNRKHKTLIEEEFDGDHSFEFRYACRGDYRDGDLINDTSEFTDVPNTDTETMAEKPFLTEDDVQFDLNHDVMLAFYEWVITATEQQYKAEASQWIVKSAMEFFYAYTHYYTMMDNRAKNTFWHFAKTGTYIEVSRPVKELLHVYEESDDNGATWHKAGTTIDSNKKYRTQYAFDMWAYDMDTAAGIDNNGQLSFPYGKEDDDYRVENTPTSGYAFNGAGSIFWRRLKTTFADEIAGVMNTAQKCFRPEDLISEFDRFQNCFPEEIWRLDIERKYIRTFTGASIDGSITLGKKNPRFLTAMMQGRKKYQRRQWIRNQSLYFNSKYRLSDITVSTNTTEFNVITPANADDPNIAVKPNYDLKLVPYQDMYINVTVGNGGPTPSAKVKAGETYILPIADYTSANFGETRIYIYGFSGISEIGNLASMYPYSFTLNALDHLKKLDMGTDASGYINANLTSLPLTKDTELPLLEEINIKNCHSLSGGLSLNQANNLRVVEATGTTITGIDLPQYTNVETLHLPSTVTSLVLYGARKLDDLQITNNNTGLIDYSRLFNLNIYDSDYSENIDWMNIAKIIIDKQSTESSISLLKLSSATIENIQALEPFFTFKSTLEKAGKNLDLSGDITITGSWSTVEKDTYEDTWPINLITDAAQEETKHKIIYQYDYTLDGEDAPRVLKTLYISHGDIIPDIYEYYDEQLQDYVHILDSMPTRDSTVQKQYQFGERLQNNYVAYSGWRLQGSTVPIPEEERIAKADNTIIETRFIESNVEYQIRWFLRKNNNGEPRDLVKTSENTVPYGGGEDEIAPTIVDIHEKYDTATATVSNGQLTYEIFTGWEKSPINIQPTVANQPYDIFATWDKGTVALIDLFADTSNLTPLQLLALSALDANTKRTYIGDKLAVGSSFTIPMGHDSSKNGTEIIGPNNSNRTIFRTDLGTALVLNTVYQPLSSRDHGFTLAIDFCFNENATYNSQIQAAVLMGCYYENSTSGAKNGLALYNDLRSGSGGIKIGFGDMFNKTGYSCTIGDSGTISRRNIVVLRKPANSDTLYIYSAYNGNVSMPAAVNEQSITCLNNINDSQLVFGQLTNSTAADYNSIKSITARAQGTIYWAKYWDEDIGVSECREIASWPHENVTYGIANLENYATSGLRRNSPTPSICLMPLSGSMCSNVVQSSVQLNNNQTFGWGDQNCNVRNICNNRILFGLPTELQAILCKPIVYYRNLIATTDAGSVITSLSPSPGTVYDYVTVPSARSLGPNDVTNEYDVEEDNPNLEPYTWYSDANVTVYNYTTTSPYWTVASESNRARFFNLRFPGFGLGNQLRIFRVTSATIPATSTIYTEINKISGNIKRGDIFISASGKAYIYVSAEDITNNGLQIEENTGIFATSNGGWVRAVEHWTRSIMHDGTRQNFVYISSAGTLTLTGGNNVSASGLSVNYIIYI